MAKIDKSKYTKQEWLVIREQRRVSKMFQKANTCIHKKYVTIF